MRSDRLAVQARPGAAQHAADVIQDGVRLPLLLEQLHVRVEQVTLCHVDPFIAELVYKLQDARGDGRLSVDEGVKRKGFKKQDDYQSAL